ncbi:hypothetical protein K7432_013544 [Basidiobolus ranarum]|uniref:Uncharacterized protein n=1 Tax=Basidiobolus ranarum TaxID=34480 RepID=A0ABR2WJ13_9FUNG
MTFILIYIVLGIIFVACALFRVCSRKRREQREDSLPTVNGNTVPAIPSTWTNIETPITMPPPSYQEAIRSPHVADVIEDYPRQNHSHVTVNTAPPYIV